MRQRQPFTLGFVGMLCVVTAFVILLYASTFQENISVILTATVLLLAGVTLSFVMVGFRLEFFNMRTMIETIIWSAVAFLTMRVVHSYVPFNLEITFMSPRLFAVLMGIAEECFFRMFLCGLFVHMTGSELLAVATSAGIWTVYHVHRYGGMGPNVFLIIFVCGCVLGFVYLKSRKSDSVLVAHGGWNWIGTA